MRYNVYAVLEVRNLGTDDATVDIYKVCPTYEDALDVYREKIGEPKNISKQVSPEGAVTWWIDKDSTGAAAINCYTLDGPLEEADAE